MEFDLGALPHRVVLNEGADSVGDYARAQIAHGVGSYRFVGVGVGSDRDPGERTLRGTYCSV